MGCEYYIKKTTNRRLCDKKVCRSNNVLDLSPSAFLPLCNQHCKIIQHQIITQIEGGGWVNDIDFSRLVNKWDTYKITLMISMLQNRKDEFARIIKSSPPINPRERRVIFDDEVKFIEEISESEILDRNNDSPVNVIPEPQKECPICLDHILIKKMTFLECAHVLCNKCLRKIQNRNVPQCPVCRHNF